MVNKSSTIKAMKSLTRYKRTVIREAVWAALNQLSQAPWLAEYMIADDLGRLQWTICVNDVTVVAYIKDPRTIPDDMAFRKFGEMTSELRLQVKKRKTIYQWVDFLNRYPQYGEHVRLLFEKLELSVYGAKAGYAYATKRQKV